MFSIQWLFRLFRSKALWRIRRVRSYALYVASVDDPLVKIGKCDEGPSVVYALTSARSRSCLYFDGADWRHVSHLEFGRIFPVYEVHLRS